MFIVAVALLPDICDIMSVQPFWSPIFIGASTLSSYLLR